MPRISSGEAKEPDALRVQAMQEMSQAFPRCLQYMESFQCMKERPVEKWNFLTRIAATLRHGPRFHPALSWECRKVMPKEVWHQQNTRHHCLAHGRARCNSANSSFYHRIIDNAKGRCVVAFPQPRIVGAVVSGKTRHCVALVAKSRYE